ncbi:MAG: two-component regulator propeller domain-containing protein, partial [Candidatus Lokiarchaeia archaeon]|nr:two-component regulator propeller domain-containing protein [Candidatus Lokiarchaeia archaeon]
MLTRIALIILICFFVISGKTQNLLFKNYRKVDGLPSLQVYHMCQDENGYMWFATDRGIARFDGRKFESYGLKDGITFMTVFKFYPQKDGNIWCSTYNNRLFYFNTTDYQFIEYKYNDSLQKYGRNYVIDDL